MLKIAVSLGNRIYDETFSYTKKCFVRHISQLSARNYLIKVKISGVEEEEAWDALMATVSHMGYDPSKDCLSAHGQLKASYDTNEQSLTEYICVEKNFDDREQKNSLLKKARKAAWDVKRKKHEFLVPSTQEYAYEINI